MKELSTSSKSQNIKNIQLREREKELQASIAKLRLEANEWALVRKKYDVSSATSKINENLEEDENEEDSELLAKYNMHEKIATFLTKGAENVFNVVCILTIQFIFHFLLIWLYT